MNRDELAGALQSESLNRVVHLDGDWEWRSAGPYQFADAILAVAREAAAATPSLDRDVLAEVMWDTSNAGAETPWIDVPLESVRRSDMLGWAQAIVREYAARLDEGSATPDQGKGEPR